MMTDAKMVFLDEGAGVNRSLPARIGDMITVE